MFVGLVEDEVQLGIGRLLDSHALELLPVGFGRLTPPRQNCRRAHCGNGTFPDCFCLLLGGDVVIDRDLFILNFFSFAFLAGEG